MKKLHHVALAVSATTLLLAAAGCSRATTTACPGVIYVAVTTDGTVRVNGNAVALDKFESTLNGLKGKSSAVWYYREIGKGEPGEAQSKAIGTAMGGIMMLGLPVSLSSKADYSDSIDADGKSLPRNSCSSPN